MSMLTFNAIDVETANADRASICQIGIVHVRDGQIVDQWETLVNPEDWFDPWNIRIHGINENTVRNSPTLPKVRNELESRLHGTILVSHSHFDRTALERGMLKYELEQLQVTWLDSAMISRRAWPDQFRKGGSGLKNIAKYLSISFNHHDALEDARAAAEIVLHACHATGLDISEWLSRVKRPILPSPRVSRKSWISAKREGNIEGPLFGETVLFTGKLSVSRNEAADMAAKVGCNVVNSSSSKVTMLVLGTQNGNQLKGYKKSSKHREVEAIIAKGAEIQILSETDFYKLIDFES